MDQPAVTKSLEKSYIQIYYTFEDNTSETSKGWDVYKVLIDSDEGRAYAKLSTDPERLQFMRLHAHEKMPIVMAQWYFYEDQRAGKEYLILIDSPEGAEVDRLMGDSDEERDEEAEEVLLRYFREHAHKVEVLKPKLGEKSEFDDKNIGE